MSFFTEKKKFQINVFNDGNERHRSEPNVWYKTTPKHLPPGKVSLVNAQSDTGIGSISEWKVGPHVAQKHAAREGIAVGMQAAGRHRDRDVTGAHTIGTQEAIGLHDARAGTGDVVLLGLEKPRMLRGLTAHQCAPGDLAAARDTRHDGSDALRHDPARGDVVGHEEWLRTAHDDVVDHHRHEVLADGVVDVHRLRDCDLGAHAIGGGGEQRARVALECARIEEPGESTEAADNLRSSRSRDGTAHEGDRALARLDVDTGVGVAEAETRIVHGATLGAEGRGTIMRVLIAVTAISAGLWMGASGLSEARPLPAADAPGQGPMFSEITKCTSERELNCVESISLVSDSGKVTNGRIVTRGTPEPWPQVDPESGDFGLSKGHGVYRGDTWQIPGLKNEWGTDYLRPLIRLSEPGVQMTENGDVWDIPAGLSIELVPGSARDSSKDQDLPVPDAKGCGKPGKPETCRKLASLDPSQKLRVVVRTSWLRPSWANAFLGDIRMTMEPLGTEGSRVVAEGKPLARVDNYFPKFTAPGDLPDYDFYLWGANFKDANDPYFPELCLGERFPVFSTNAGQWGIPDWDPEAQELRTPLSGSHFNAKGKLFRGSFDALIPLELAECLWNINPRQLKDRLSIEVYAEDGDEQAATSSLTTRGGYLRIAARNFHFSKPTIVIKEKRKR